MDLRFASSEEQLDLQDPRFADAVADIASAIRGIPKDELASEEVRQHRRTVRTAWAAGVAVVVLGVAAAVGAVVAVGQSSEARSQRDEAERQARIATDNEQRALDAEDEALAERDRADREAQIARSNELAAASTSALDSNPELATLLAILSITETPDGDEAPTESVRALRRARAANRLVHRFGGDEHGTDVRVAMSRDGRTAYYAQQFSREIVAFDPNSGEVLWAQAFEGTAEVPFDVFSSPDGTVVAATVQEQDQHPLVSEDAVPRDEVRTRVLILDAASGDVITWVPQTCPFAYLGNSPFSSDGSVLAVQTGSGACRTDPAEDWVSFIDTSTWEEVGRLELDGVWAETASFARDANLLLVGSDATNSVREIRSYPDLAVVRTFSGSSVGGTNVGPAAISPAGDRVAFPSARNLQYAIHMVSTGEFLGFAQVDDPFVRSARFSPDGTVLALFTRTSTAVVDGWTGEPLVEVTDGGNSITGDFSPDGRTLVTGESSGFALVWELGGAGIATEQIGAGESIAVWINPARIIEGPRAAVQAYAGDLAVFAGAVHWLHIVDEQTGETLQSVEAVTAAQLPDGRFAIVEQEDVLDAEGRRIDLSLGGIAIWDPETGDRNSITQCAVLLSDVEDGGSPAVCPDGELAYSTHFYGEPWILVSPGGDMIAADGWGEPAAVRVWDVATGDAVLTIEAPPSELVPNSYADIQLVGLGDDWVAILDHETGTTTVYDLDGATVAEVKDLLLGGHIPPQWLAEHRTIVVLRDGSGATVAVLDTDAWQEIAEWIPNDGSFVRGFQLSPDGGSLATAGEDGVVRVWDVSALHSGPAMVLGEAPPLLDEIPTGVVSDVLWVSADTLAVVTRTGGWAIVSLDADVLVEEALAGLTRSFSERECQSYRIDPCPTLEELRSGG